MESVLDNCLAQFSSKYVLKEEQPQAVLCLMLVFTKLKQREKNVVLVASLLQSIIKI